MQPHHSESGPKAWTRRNDLTFASPHTGCVRQPWKWCFRKEATVVSDAVEPAVVQWTLKSSCQPALREVNREPAGGRVRHGSPAGAREGPAGVTDSQQQRPSYSLDAQCSMKTRHNLAINELYITMPEEQPGAPSLSSRALGSVEIPQPSTN